MMKPYDMNLTVRSVILIHSTLLAHCALSDSGQCLSYCICDATQHLHLLSACNRSTIRSSSFYSGGHGAMVVSRYGERGRAHVRIMMRSGQDGIHTALVIIVVSTAHIVKMTSL
jgi:hypothetical protein